MIRGGADGSMGTTIAAVIWQAAAFPECVDTGGAAVAAGPASGQRTNALPALRGGRSCARRVSLGAFPAAESSAGKSMTACGGCGLKLTWYLIAAACPPASRVPAEVHRGRRNIQAREICQVRDPIAGAETQKKGRRCRRHTASRERHGRTRGPPRRPRHRQGHEPR
jgi:hypothetical protein